MWVIVNVWAILVAAVSGFALGALWYSPALFLNSWLHERKMKKEAKVKHKPMVHGISFVLSIVSVSLLSLFLGPNPPLSIAVGSGFLIGLCWVLSSFASHYLYTGQSFKLFLIDGGYYLLQFTLFGLVLGLFPA